MAGKWVDIDAFFEANDSTVKKGWRAMRAERHQEAMEKQKFSKNIVVEEVVDDESPKPRRTVTV